MSRIVAPPDIDVDRVVLQGGFLDTAKRVGLVQDIQAQTGSRCSQSRHNGPGGISVSPVSIWFPVASATPKGRSLDIL